jgi:predicted transcriptional regulator
MSICMYAYMKHHRSGSEIIASILEVTNGNRVRLTEILYKTYLSHGILKEYLLLLLEKDLVQYIQGERTYKTTEKGMCLLRMYNEMGELMVAKTDTGEEPVMRVGNYNSKSLEERPMLSTSTTGANTG